MDGPAVSCRHATAHKQNAMHALRMRKSSAKFFLWKRRWKYVKYGGMESYAHAHLPKDVSAYSNNNPGSIRPVVPVRQLVEGNCDGELSSRTNCHCELPLRTSIMNFHCSTLGWKLLTLLGFRIVEWNFNCRMEIFPL